ncbi:hypothetical protein GEMRC1_010658 [Eukaryota sp. GEM-RC1]
MRLRCYLWPYNLPNDLQCSCGKQLTFSHLLSCNRYITYRTCMHDAVRDQIHAMCKSYKIESFVEPLLRSLEPSNNCNVEKQNQFFGKRRADVVVPSSSDKLFVVDVVSVDVCKKTSLKNASSETSPLDISEQAKQDKYRKPLMALKHVKHVEYELCPFAVSIYGRLGKSALNFLNDFGKIVKNMMNKRFDHTLWLNRIVFTVFKTVPLIISKALLAVSAFYEDKAVVRFDSEGCCFNDIKF